MRIFHCPECGSRRAWRNSLLHSNPFSCPSCGTMLALKNPPSFLDLLLLGIVLASSLGSVVSDFATDRVGALGKGAHIGVVVAILAICVLSRGRWMRDPSALSLCEIRAKVRLAEEFLRHGGGAADAARQVGVPYAVLRAWRKQYGRASSEPGEE